MKYLLLSLILVSTPIFASEPAKYITELVCENPTGCPFENGVCIGCVEKKTHPPAPTINNYNKTEIHNHHYKTLEIPVTTKVVHEHVTVTEPVERLRPYISIDDNDKVSVTGVKHLGNNIWQFKTRVGGKPTRCTSNSISPVFTSGGGSCANEFFHYTVDWE